MANKMTSTKQGQDNAGTPASTGHNSVKISDSLVESMKAIYQAEKAERAAIENHVQCHRDDKKRHKANMKKDTEISIKDFNFFYAIYKRQMEANDIMEEDDRARVKEDLATCFDAANQGQLFDFLIDHNAELIKKTKAAKKGEAANESDKEPAVKEGTA